MSNLLYSEPILFILHHAAWIRTKTLNTSNSQNDGLGLNMLFHTEDLKCVGRKGKSLLMVVL